MCRPGARLTKNQKETIMTMTLFLKDSFPQIVKELCPEDIKTSLARIMRCVFSLQIPAQQYKSGNLLYQAFQRA